MHVTINNKKYKLTRRSGAPLDLYYNKGILVDDAKHKFLYNKETIVDGQRVGVMAKRVYVLCAIIFICTVCICVWFANIMSRYYKESVAVDTVIDTGQEEVTPSTKIPVVKDTVLLRYNKFMLYDNGKVDIKFINGSHEATLTIKADGVECEPVTITPEQEIIYLPIKLSTDEPVISGNLLYTYDGKTLEYQIVIENMTHEDEIIDEDITLQDEEVIYE